MMSFTPDFFGGVGGGGGGNWCPQIYTDTRILPHYPIRVAFSRTRQVYLIIWYKK